MRDRDAFALGAAVDNLIKITAGENGCRYSHALTACNMLPAFLWAQVAKTFLFPRSKRPIETIGTPISISKLCARLSLMYVRVGSKEGVKKTSHRKGRKY